MPRPSGCTRGWKLPRTGSKSSTFSSLVVRPTCSVIRPSGSSPRLCVRTVWLGTPPGRRCLRQTVPSSSKRYSVAAKPTIPVVPDARNPKPNPNPENLSNKGTARATSKPANENEVITDSAVVPGSSACEPYREAIELGISRGRNARAIWQDLVSEYGFASSYQSVQRFVRKRHGTQTPEARVVIVTAPDQEAQVDYGTGPMVRDPESRKYRRTRLFVMTLGCSRKSVRLLTFRSSSRIWAELHERAFRRLGGATRIVVLDNLREGVLVPDIYDPALNPLYRDVLAHYGAVAMPCRIQDPD